MKSMIQFAWRSALLCMCSVSIACTQSASYETYILPEGFVGPVVVLFEQPDGITATPANNGDTIFRVPVGGILLVTNKAPESGFYALRFLVEDGATGGAQALALNALDTEPQVFGYIAGSTGMVDRMPTGDLQWVAFIVGVPAEKDNWAELREKRVSDAVKEIMRRRHPNHRFE